jgi:hypothetical protein
MERIRYRFQHRMRELMGIAESAEQEEWTWRSMRIRSSGSGSDTRRGESFVDVMRAGDEVYTGIGVAEVIKEIR